MSDEANTARIEELLRDIHELTEENNRLVRRVLRDNAIAFWSKVIIWIAVIVLPLIFWKPILNTLLPFTGSTSGGNSYGLPSQAQIQQLLQDYKDQHASK